MTRKEELLEFANLQLGNPDKIARLQTEANGVPCTLTMVTRQIRFIEIITANFDDDLSGYLPNAPTVLHHILDWNIVDRPMPPQ